MANDLSFDPDAFLTRDQSAAALTDCGYPVRPKTLATMATRGGGPQFRRFGHRPLYRWADLIAWAEGRLSGPMRSTSESDAANVAQSNSRVRTEGDRSPQHGG